MLLSAYDIEMAGFSGAPVPLAVNEIFSLIHVFSIL